MENLAERLKQNSVFGVLKPAERDLVTAQAVRKRFAAGNIIAHITDIWPYLFLVENGQIHAQKESFEGRSLIVTSLNSGELFWGPAFFEENVPMLAMLIAQKESRIWLWHRDELRPILWGNGRSSWELSRLMVQRMQRASDIVEGLAFQPVQSRLAQLLLGHFGDAVDNFVSRDLTLDEMAARVGTKREMVCRLLYQFAEAGAIEISRTEFMIKNPAKLQNYTQQSKG